MENVYGLGQQFKKLGSADGDWVSHGIREGEEFGNGFMGFGNSGMVGNVQFPIMYALGKNNINYALMLDNVYKHKWNFKGESWNVQMFGDQIRFYVMGGDDLLDLRKDYMELVGRPPVPPKKSLGLWVSEFGYENWRQVDNLKTGLRNDDFPIDGFVLDLQWFGGIIKNNPDSPMGKLDWDQDRYDNNDFYFPNPAPNIAYFANDNIGFITIEESYVGKKTNTFRQMNITPTLFAYARNNNNQCDDTSQYNPVILSEWFGVSGMIDWSDPKAGLWVHDNRRFPNLVQKGIVGHWTDLGEPEKYNAGACYNGVETTAVGLKNNHSDIHNLYNFLWNKSIYEGYVRKNGQVNRRPFIVTRSGAPGSQRFGVAMWSGDIGSNLELLATHLNAQMHMSFSGIDYYGSDIGGFRREGIPYNDKHSGSLQYENELYTQWFANGVWFDVPIRPHTDNSFQKNKRYETSPNLVGIKRINLANLRQRYELTPYYYSLSYRAYLYGEPVIPPLVFYYQNDPEVRQMGHEKLIGRNILVGVVAQHGEYQRDIYLPKGKWVNYQTNEWFTSSGEWVRNFPIYIDGILRLPTFLKAGSIVPTMYVDKETKDVFGHRKDGTSHNELIVKVYGDTAATEFTLYEDDGTSIGYDSVKKPKYDYRTANIFQKSSSNTATVLINKSSGSYNGAVTQRNNTIKLALENTEATKVTMNGTNLVMLTTEEAFNAAPAGWYNTGHNVVLAKSGIQNVSTNKNFQFTLRSVHPKTSVHFVCDNGWTNLGEEIYIVGNIAELGNWDPGKAVKLEPNIYYEYIYNPPHNHNGPGPKTPKWTELVLNLPANTNIEWKCIKRLNTGNWQWEQGSNNKITTKSSGFSGTSIGAF